MRQILGSLALAGLWALHPSADGATLSAGIGQFRGEDASQTQTLYLIEIKNDKRSFSDFRATVLNHSDGKSIWDSAEFSYQGLGFDFEPIRLNLEIGWFNSLAQFARDEIDYGISRSIGGGQVDIDLDIVRLWGGFRRYLPYESRKAKVDSFDLTFNPEPYMQARAGVSIIIKNIEIDAETGRFQDLKGRIDYLGESFLMQHDPVSYGKATLKLASASGKGHSILLVEWHQLLKEPEDRETFQKLLGTALQRDVFDGGIVALGLEF